MNQLSLDNKPWSYIQIGIGVLFLIAGFSFILSHVENFSRLDYLLAFGFTITGLLQIANFGLQKSFLRKCDNCLQIKWINKLRTQEIEYTQIESIYLRKAEIIINQNNKKTLKLNLLTFRTEQRRSIYEFFMNLATDQKLNLIRQFS